MKGHTWGKKGCLTSGQSAFDLLRVVGTSELEPVSKSKTKAVRPGKNKSFVCTFDLEKTALKTALPAAELNLTTCKLKENMLQHKSQYDSRREK